jgi:murein L,D-transpeptidase YcbB/YkuD
MAVHVWLVPSNQLHNLVAGDPNPAPGSTTEEQIAVIRAMEAQAEANRQGVKAHMAYLPGYGSSSVDELTTMLNRMMNEIRALPSTDRAYVLSLHSDAGGRQDVYPLTCRTTDNAWAARMGTDLAQRIGFAVQSPSYRPDLAFSSRVDDLPAQRAVLMEIGAHGYTAGPVYGMAGPAALWKYARFHGLMAMRAFAKQCGFLKSDGPIPRDVIVPSGFEYWYGAVPTGGTEPPYTRLLKLTSPYMRGDDVKWAQGQLTKAGFPCVADGIFGPKTDAAVRAFQTAHGLTVDGIVGPKTWTELREW